MRLALFAALLLATACSSAPKPALETRVHPGLARPAAPRTIPPPAPEEAALAARAAEEAERRWGLQAEAVWRRWVGREGPAMDEPPAFLLAPETVLALERAAAHAEDPAAGRRYAGAHAYLAGAYLDRAVRAFDERLEEAHRGLLARGRTIGAEAHALERGRKGAALLEASEALLPDLAAREAAFMAGLEALEHEHAFAARARLAGVEAEALIRLAASLLQATDGLWREAFGDAAARTLGLPLSELGWVDLPRILRGAGLVVPLRHPSPGETLDATLAGLGIELGAVEGLRVEALPGGRSLCLPGRGGARLALPAEGGPSHRALFRDVGCALAAARCGALPPEPLLRGFGGLFARLTDDPEWLAAVGETSAAEARARSAAAALRRLYLVRHHAARLLAAAERDQGDYEASYARHMSRALGVAVPGAASRLERADLLWAIEGLRGALLASTLREALGPGWWRAPEGAERLEALLSASAQGLEALLGALGREAIEVEPFVDEVGAALERPEALASR